jgi:hypothetical protein
MPAKKTSVFKEPAVIVALIGLVGILVTSIFAPLILKPAATETAAASTPLPSDAEYAAQLFSEAQSWQLVALDSFDTGNLNWPQGDTAGQSGEGNRSLLNGVYSWRVAAKTNSANLWAIPNTEILRDFYVAVDCKNTKRLEIIACALSFRHHSVDNHYDFMVYPSQKFSAHYKREGGDSVTLSSLPSTAVLPYDTNHIAVIGIGSQFWFYINGVFVDYITDDKIPTGSYGIGVSVKSAGDEGYMEFDNFELRRAP